MSDLAPLNQSCEEIFSKESNETTSDKRYQNKSSFVSSMAIDINKTEIIALKFARATKLSSNCGLKTKEDIQLIVEGIRHYELADKWSLVIQTVFGVCSNDPSFEALYERVRHRFDLIIKLFRQWVLDGQMEYKPLVVFASQDQRQRLVTELIEDAQHVDGRNVFSAKECESIINAMDEHDFDPFFTLKERTDRDTHLWEEVREGHLASLETEREKKKAEKQLKVKMDTYEKWLVARIAEEANTTGLASVAGSAAQTGKQKSGAVKGRKQSAKTQQPTSKQSKLKQMLVEETDMTGNEYSVGMVNASGSLQPPDSVNEKVVISSDRVKPAQMPIVPTVALAVSEVTSPEQTALALHMHDSSAGDVNAIVYAISAMTVSDGSSSDTVQSGESSMVSATAMDDAEVVTRTSAAHAQTVDVLTAADSNSGGVDEGDFCEDIDNAPVKDIVSDSVSDVENAPVGSNVWVDYDLLFRSENMTNFCLHALRWEVTKEPSAFRNGQLYEMIEALITARYNLQSVNLVSLLKELALSGDQEDNVVTELRTIISRMRAIHSVAIVDAQHIDTTADNWVDKEPLTLTYSEADNYARELEEEDVSFLGGFDSSTHTTIVHTLTLHKFVLKDVRIEAMCRDLRGSIACENKCDVDVVMPTLGSHLRFLINRFRAKFAVVHVVDTLVEGDDSAGEADDGTDESEAGEVVEEFLSPFLLCLLREEYNATLPGMVDALAAANFVGCEVDTEVLYNDVMRDAPKKMSLADFRIRLSNAIMKAGELQTQASIDAVHIDGGEDWEDLALTITSEQMWSHKFDCENDAAFCGGFSNYPALSHICEELERAKFKLCDLRIDALCWSLRNSSDNSVSEEQLKTLGEHMKFLILRFRERFPECLEEILNEENIYEAYLDTPLLFPTNTAKEFCIAVLMEEHNHAMVDALAAVDFVFRNVDVIGLGAQIMKERNDPDLKMLSLLIDLRAIIVSTAELRTQSLADALYIEGGDDWVERKLGFTEAQVKAIARKHMYDSLFMGGYSFEHVTKICDRLCDAKFVLRDVHIDRLCWRLRSDGVDADLISQIGAHLKYLIKWFRAQKGAEESMEDEEEEDSVQEGDIDGDAADEDVCAEGDSNGRDSAGDTEEQEEQNESDDVHNDSADVGSVDDSPPPAIHPRRTTAGKYVSPPPHRNESHLITAMVPYEDSPNTLVRFETAQKCTLLNSQSNLSPDTAVGMYNATLGSNALPVVPFSASKSRQAASGSKLQVVHNTVKKVLTVAKIVDDTVAQHNASRTYLSSMGDSMDMMIANLMDELEGNQYLRKLGTSVYAYRQQQKFTSLEEVCAELETAVAYLNTHYRSVDIPYLNVVKDAMQLLHDVAMFDDDAGALLAVTDGMVDAVAAAVDKTGCEDLIEYYNKASHLLQAYLTEVAANHKRGVVQDFAVPAVEGPVLATCADRVDGVRKTLWKENTEGELRVESAENVGKGTDTVTRRLVKGKNLDKAVIQEGVEKERVQWQEKQG